MPLLPEDEEAELAALGHLSDDALWTIARERMGVEQEERLQLLMDGNSLGTLSDGEFRELGQLVDRGQKLMLRKAAAAALLTQRGFSVNQQSLA